IKDTTGFSRVVVQFQPKDNPLGSETPPALAAWCFNFNLRISHSDQRHHRLSAGWCFHFAHDFGESDLARRRVKLKYHAAEAGGVLID
ncbi:MAG: hypothetical protein WAV47_04155, partial [Blastocatellia bacterium]